MSHDTHLSLWAADRLHNISELRFRVTKTLMSARSEFQHVAVVDTEGYGRMLFNDSVAMISTRDEFIYHEMIAHVPMFVHPAVRRALVIGGGDGGTVRELLRHRGVERVDLVEIDRLVVDACREHIPETAAALDDPRCRVIIDDGKRFVAEAPDGAYELVIVDSTDPAGPSVPLFGAEFYDDVHRVLGPDGIAIAQAESPSHEPATQRRMLGLMRDRFSRVQLYNYANLIYPGGLWSFSYACKRDLCPVGDFDEARVAASALRFRYYSPAIHRAAFVHPQYQVDALAGLLSPWKSTRG